MDEPFIKNRCGHERIVKMLEGMLHPGSTAERVRFLATCCIFVYKVAQSAPPKKVSVSIHVEPVARGSFDSPRVTRVRDDAWKQTRRVLGSAGSICKMFTLRKHLVVLNYSVMTSMQLQVPGQTGSMQRDQVKRSSVKTSQTCFGIS